MVEFDPGWLITRVAATQDRDAFVTLFEHYAPRVKSMMIRRGASPDRAEDLAQETLLRLWRNAGLFDPQRATASSWVYSIARNAGIDLGRRDVRAVKLLETEAVKDEGQADPVEPEGQLLAAEREDLVRTSISTLPSDQLRVVRLSFFDGLAHAEIAKLLGIPLGTVKSRMRLALHRLRGNLGELR